MITSAKIADGPDEKWNPKSIPTLLPTCLRVGWDPVVTLIRSNHKKRERMQINHQEENGFPR